MKKQINAILFIAMITGIIASCGDGAPSAETETTAQDAGTTVDDTESNDGFISDNLSKDLNFGEKTVNILVGDVHSGTTLPTYFVEQESGDVVDDAVYNRNKAVEERLNVKLEYNCVNFDYGTMNNYTTAITTAVMSGDGSTHLICGPGFYTTNLILDDCFIDLSTLKYLDFDKPRWTEMYNETATINGRIYSALGDYSLNKLQLSYVMYFNKDLFDSAKLDYPYGDVISGDWTFDKLNLLVRDTYHDLDSDGKKSVGDSFGVVSQNGNSLWAFMDSFGVKVFDADTEGKVQFTMDSEHGVDVIAKLNTFFNENENVYNHQYMGNDAVDEDIFAKHNTYITIGTLGETSRMREYDFDYGILPYPKYDNTYKSYMTRSSSAASVFCIPVSCPDMDMTAAVLEALNSESYRTVIPAYYETALKVKYARDSETIEVLDIVKNSISMQFVDIFSQVFSGYSAKFRDVIYKNNNTWVSQVAEIKTAANEKLSKLLEYYNQ